MSRAFRAAALQLRGNNGDDAFDLPLRFGARNQPCPPRDLTATVLASTADGEPSVPFPVAIMSAAASECIERQICGNQLCSAPGSDPTTSCSDCELTGRTPRWSLSMHVAVHDGGAIEVSADALSAQSETSCAGVAKIELR